MSKTSILFILISFILVITTSSIKAENSSQDALQLSEEMIDAFYSFNLKDLKTILNTASSSKAFILFYQGWAKGANYKIVKRPPCIQSDQDNLNNKSISCSITVKDDLMKALDVAFDVTDTFHLNFENGILSQVKTSSNDLNVYLDAGKWVWSEHPEWLTEPCKGFFNGGPTPEKCVQAMIKGYAEFAKSRDFPENIIF